MSGAEERIAELSLLGYGCSQILLQLALDASGQECPEVLRAVSGLHGGLGYTGRLCGALTGGCCALGLRAGRGAPGESEDPRLGPMIRTLVDWFDREVAARWGGADCSAILGGDARNQLTRCPAIVLGVHRKLEELLAAEGLGPAPAGG